MPLDPPTSALTPKCVIVVPCYNEAARLPTTTFESYLSEVEDVSFLFVNDGSKDQTEEVLEKLCDKHPRRLAKHSLSKNSGKAEAVRQGLLVALERGPEVVGFWDADLATPLEAIEDLRGKLIEQTTLEMVIGARVKLLGRDIDRNPMRHYLGRVFATAASIVLSLPVHDTQCGAKLFRVTPVLKQILSDPFRSNWVFDVELLARYLRATPGGTEMAKHRIYEFPLHTWKDIKGSKVKPWDFFVAFKELLDIYWHYLRPGKVSARRTAQMVRAASVPE